MQRFRETVKGKEVAIEVWPPSDAYQPRHVRYTGYAFCPMKECRHREAFRAEGCATVDKAKKEAKSIIGKHLSREHNL